MSLPLEQHVAAVEDDPRADLTLRERQQRPICLVHIGYHRTGTSFLQTELFPLIPFSAMTQHVEEAERIAADPSLQLVILSAEHLSSDLKRDKPEFASGLARKFPDARILIGIRSQYSVMRGIYHLFIKAGGTEDYESFVKARCGRLFDYAGAVDAYRAAFGAENVFVMLHEDLTRNPLRAMSKLLEFASLDPGLAAKVINRRVKPSVGDGAMVILRLRNRLIAPLCDLLPRLHSQIVYRGLPGISLIDRVFGKLLRLPTDRVRPMIHGAYAESNARLFAALGLDGTDYDYPLPGRF